MGTVAVHRRLPARAAAGRQHGQAIGFSFLDDCRVRTGEQTMTRRAAVFTFVALLFCGRLAAEERLPVHIAEGMWSEHWRLPDILGAKYQVSQSFLTSR